MPADTRWLRVQKYSAAPAAELFSWIRTESSTRIGGRNWHRLRARNSSKGRHAKQATWFFGGGIGGGCDDRRNHWRNRNTGTSERPSCRERSGSEGSARDATSGPGSETVSGEVRKIRSDAGSIGSRSCRADSCEPGIARERRLSVRDGLDPLRLRTSG